MRLPPTFDEAFRLAGYGAGEPSHEDYEAASKPNAPPELIEKFKRWEDQYEKEVDSFLRELTTLFMAGLPCNGRRNISESEREVIPEHTWIDCDLILPGYAVSKHFKHFDPQAHRRAIIGPYIFGSQGQWCQPIVWVDLWFDIAKFRVMRNKEPQLEEAESEEPPRKSGPRSKMTPVMAEFRRRKATNTLSDGIGATARSLLTWAKDNHLELPALKTIKNNIGPEFPLKPKMQKTRI